MSDPREAVDTILVNLLEAPQSVNDLTRERVVALVAFVAARQSELAALQCVLTARLVETAPQPAESDTSSERLLSVAEAAEILNVSPRWISRRSDRLPFVRRLTPRVLRISESGLRNWMMARRNTMAR